MISEPKVQFREEQPYLAIRTKVHMKDIPEVLPPLIPEVFSHLNKNNITQQGPAFFQYLSMDKSNEIVAEVGVPVEKAVATDDRITGGAFPAGNYATGTYTGDYKNLKEAHMAMESWINNNGWRDKVLNNHGAVFGSRTEFYITDPQSEPDPGNWKTDIAVLVEEAVK